MNVFNVIGNLTKDPELRDTQSSGKVVSFDIAENYRESDGSDGTEFYRVSMFGKRAESCAQYLKKGSKVFVTGTLRDRKYTKKDGTEGKSKEIRANDISFLSRPPQSDGNDAVKKPPVQEAQTQTDADEDDLPF